MYQVIDSRGFSRTIRKKYLYPFDGNLTEPEIGTVLCVVFTVFLLGSVIQAQIQNKLTNATLKCQVSALSHDEFVNGFASVVNVFFGR